MSKSLEVSFIQRDMGITNPKTNGHPNYVVMQVSKLATKNRKTKNQKSLGLSFNDYLQNRLALAGYFRLLAITPEKRHKSLGGLSFANSLLGYADEYSASFAKYIPKNILVMLIVEYVDQNADAGLDIPSKFKFVVANAKNVVNTVDTKYKDATKATYRSIMKNFVKMLARKMDYFEENLYPNFKPEAKVNQKPAKKQINLFEEIGDVELEMLLLEVVLQFKELTIDDFLSFERLPCLSNDKTGILEKLSQRTNNPFKHLSKEKIEWLKKMRVKADEITALFDEGNATTDEKKQLIKLFIR